MSITSKSFDPSFRNILEIGDGMIGDYYHLSVKTYTDWKESP